MFILIIILLLVIIFFRISENFITADSTDEGLVQVSSSEVLLPVRKLKIK